MKSEGPQKRPGPAGSAVLKKDGSLEHDELVPTLLKCQRARILEPITRGSRGQVAHSRSDDGLTARCRFALTAIRLCTQTNTRYYRRPVYLPPSYSYSLRSRCRIVVARFSVPANSLVNHSRQSSANVTSLIGWLASIDWLAASPRHAMLLLYRETGEVPRRFLTAFGIPARPITFDYP